MADVISISDWRRQHEKISFNELVAKCVDEIQSQWEKFAINNRLNDYFLSCTQPYSDTSKNYLEDITAISIVEGKISLEPMIMAAGFSKINSIGWIASCKIDENVASTPQLINENYCRCFNILLFLKLQREIYSGKLKL